MLRQNAQHAFVNASVRCYHLLLHVVKRPTAHARDLPTRLLDDERAGRGIPRSELLFPKSVEAPAGDVAQVQGSGTVSPDRARRTHETLEQTKIASRSSLRS